MFEHLAEGPCPLSHAGGDKAVDIALGWLAISPGRRLGCKDACMLGDKVSVRSAPFDGLEHGAAVLTRAPFSPALANSSSNCARCWDPAQLAVSPHLGIPS